MNNPTRKLNNTHMKTNIAVALIGSADKTRFADALYKDSPPIDGMTRMRYVPDINTTAGIVSIRLNDVQPQTSIYEAALCRQYHAVIAFVDNHNHDDIRERITAITNPTRIYKPTNNRDDSPYIHLVYMRKDHTVPSEIPEHHAGSDSCAESRGIPGRDHTILDAGKPLREDDLYNILMTVISKTFRDQSVQRIKNEPLRYEPAVPFVWNREEFAPKTEPHKKPATEFTFAEFLSFDKLVSMRVDTKAETKAETTAETKAETTSLPIDIADLVKLGAKSVSIDFNARAVTMKF